MNKPKKYHFSPITKDWERCSATKKGCKYGPNAHKTAEELKASAEQRKSAIQKIKDSSPENVNALFGKEMEKKLGKKYTDAYEGYTVAQTKYSQLSKDSVDTEKISVASDFKNQLETKSDNNASILGKIALGSIPKAETFREEAKLASQEEKEELARASMVVSETEENFREVVLSGVATR